MKKILFSFFILLTFCSFSQVKNLQENSTFYDFLTIYASENGDSIPSKHIQRLEKLWGAKLAPSGDASIAALAYYEYAQNYENYQSTTYEPNWEEIGPIGTNTEATNGQIHNIVFDPGYNITNQTIYACSSFGGLYRSEDDGYTWSNVNTDVGIELSSVSDLAIHPTSPNILFLSTGFADGGLVQYQTRASHVNPVHSLGVYRSTDYGATWEAINNGLDSMLQDGWVIREIEINPNNPNQLFIATDRGVYRTNNANASAPTWTLVLEGNPGVDDTEFKGLEFKPDNSNTIYASGQDIYKSTDGGNTWTSMTGANTGLDYNDFNNLYKVNRINITTTPAAPDRLYAYIEIYEGNEATHYHALYIYMYNGTNWDDYLHYFSSTSVYEALTQGRIAIAVSPIDPNAVYYGTTKLYGCNDITSSDFVDLSNYKLGDPFHVDIHALEFQPNISNPKLFCGNDGGINVKSPPFNNIYNWEARCQGLGVSTLWSFDDSENNENYILSGFQDNGIKKFINGSWEQMWSTPHGDGYAAQINDVNDKNAFFRTNKKLYRYNFYSGQKSLECYNTTKSSTQGSSDYRPWDTYQQDTTPTSRACLYPDFEIKNEPKSGDMYWTFTEIHKRLKEIPESGDNTNPDNLWDATSNISTVIPDSIIPQWKRQINRFEISEANPNYRYLITMGFLPAPENIAPYKTHLFRTTTGDNNYEEVILPGQVSEEDYVLASDIVVDPLDPQRIWVSFTGFNQEYRVWYSEDAGDTWGNADPNNSLPRIAIHAITYQKGSNDILYIATDAGVYVKNGPGVDWEKYGACPNVVVQDLKINYCNNKLRIATFGRGVWQADIIETEGDLPEIAYSPGDINLWDTEVDRGLRNNVRIESGHTFTIQGNISMPRNGKITVEPGAKLIIDGGKLTNNCGGQWQGIHVLGNKNLPQTEANQGVVEVINGGTIENAAYGIYAGNPDNVVDNQTGGIVRVEDAVFTNNRVAIYIPSYTESENQSYIYNSSFTTTPEYYALENNNTAVRPFIELWDTGSIDIQGNTFENTCVMGVDAPVHKQGVGIHVVDADMTVTPFGENPNEFINLYKGIEVEDTADGSTNDINNNIFTGCVIGLHLNNANHVSFTENQIDLYNETHLGDPHKPTGLYITQSQGFHIEANEIADSSTTTPNETVGIYVRDCSSENQFYRNFFTNLDIGVFAEGSNIGPSITEYGLRILCNEFDDVDHDIYVAPVSWIAFDQGSERQSAGNQFTPECSGTYDEFDNNGWQVNYYKVDIPEYVPLCNYNVNLLTARAQHDCISGLGDQHDFEEKLLTYDTEINTIDAELQTLTDGGDTEGLNETVEETEPNEALMLRNELLSQSPTLSDSTMVHTTSIEDVLPAIMVKEVLAANPKAAKSDEVQTALDDRNDPLPEYMRDEIDLGKTLLSYKEELESKLSENIHERENLINRRLFQLNQEGSTESLDTLENILVSEAQNKLNRAYQLVKHYLDRGDEVAAQGVFDAIPDNFNLDATQQSKYDLLTQFYTIRFNLEASDKTWFEMDATQYQTIQDLAVDSTATAGMQSRAVLSLVDHITYPCYVPDIVVTPKSGYAGTYYEETFKVYPQEANDYFIIEYALAEDEKPEHTLIKVYDEAGKEMQSFTLKTMANQFLSECGTWREGTYWVYKEVDGAQTEQEPVFIKRGGDTTLERITGINELSLFPNPAQDYFFVQFNAESMEALEIQILDTQAKVLRHQNLTQRQMQIDTENWQSGVYIINILQNGIVMDTAKMVVK